MNTVGDGPRTSLAKELNGSTVLGEFERAAEGVGPYVQEKKLLDKTVAKLR